MKHQSKTQSNSAPSPKGSQGIAFGINWSPLVQLPQGKEKPLKQLAPKPRTERKPRVPKNLAPVKLKDLNTGKCFMGLKKYYNPDWSEKKVVAHFTASGRLFPSRGALIKSIKEAIKGRKADARGVGRGEKAAHPNLFKDCKLVFVEYAITGEHSFDEDPEVFAELL